MTSYASPNTETPARRAVQLPADQRQERVDVARWALANGRPMNLDAITVVLAAKAFEAGLEGRPYRRWTSAGVLTFLLGSAVEWCRQSGVERPPSFGETLFTYLSWVAETGQLASGSSPRGELLDAAADVGGLTRAGRSRVRPGSSSAIARSLHRASTTSEGR